MNIKHLNEMIEHIEKNLTEEIDFKDLAKMIGVSEYNLQRIFMFLTNMSLVEYIRKRKLSRAYEDLKIKGAKVIDVALNYGYNSQISFARAFKNMFGISPSECKKSNKEFVMFPIIRFNNNNEVCEELSYEIKKVDCITLYGKNVFANTLDDLLYKIRELYAELEKSGLYQQFNSSGLYGVSFYDNGHGYFVGSTKQVADLKEFVIPKGEYVVFDCKSREQKDIVKTEKLIYTQWLNSTNYKIDDNFNFELYEKDKCYLYMLLKGKQN